MFFQHDGTVYTVRFSLFNTVYIGMVTHERTEGQCPVII